MIIAKILDNLTHVLYQKFQNFEGGLVRFKVLYGLRIYAQGIEYINLAHEVTYENKYQSTCIHPVKSHSSCGTVAGQSPVGFATEIAAATNAQCERMKANTAHPRQSC